MSNASKIEWTQATWNPVTGCDKVSTGCKRCYAERLAKRLKAMRNPRYAAGFDVTLHEDLLGLPLTWKKPRLIFVNSMSDLFHPDIPLTFINRAFDTMRNANWHQFQILTKRSERLLELSSFIDWPPNVWMGVSIERQDYAFRISHLRETGAAIKFLSLEPLLGPLAELDLEGIDWAIVGGESGAGGLTDTNCRGLTGINRMTIFYTTWRDLTMRNANWHQFQILTKRSERLLELSSFIDWPPNVWMGVSIERQDYAFRISHLRETGAAIKFLSLEPLLGPLAELDLEGIDWAIVGGESGPGARPIEERWVLNIKDQCLSADVPFFFKQWGGTNKKKAGRLLEGRTWDDLPRHCDLQHFANLS